MTREALKLGLDTRDPYERRGWLSPLASWLKCPLQIVHPLPMSRCFTKVECKNTSELALLLIQWVFDEAEKMDGNFGRTASGFQAIVNVVSRQASNDPQSRFGGPLPGHIEIRSGMPKDLLLHDRTKYN